MKITPVNAKINIANNVFENHISNRYKSLCKKSLTIESKFKKLIMLNLLNNFNNLNEKEKIKLLNNFNHVC